jgi:putative peptidoglycan lipid II flippase
MMQSPTEDVRPGRTTPTNGSRLLKIVVGLSGIALVTKLFGFGEKLAVAHFLGTSETADVYFAVTSIVLTIVWLVRELIHPSLLPVFAAAIHESPKVAGHLFKRMLFGVVGILSLAAAILIFTPNSVTRVLLPGFSGAKQDLASQVLRMLSPALVFLGLSTLIYTCLGARRQFIKAAWPEAAMKFLIFAGILMLMPRLGIYALPLAMGVGALTCLSIQLAYLPDRRLLLDAGRPPQVDVHVKRTLTLMAPLVLGLVFSHANGLLDNVLASMLPQGQMSYLGYSKKLADAILLVGPAALVTVVYSELSHLASGGRHAEFADLMGRMFRLLVYLGVPAACLLAMLREPIIRFLFERGAFGPASTQATAQAFAIYALGLTTFAVESLFVYGLFALGDTRTPVKIGILCSLLDVALAVALLRPLAYLGIAGAFVVSRTIKVALLGAILDRRLHNVLHVGFLKFSFKVAVTTAVAMLAARSLLLLDNAPSAPLTAVCDLALPALGALLTFILVSHALRIDEFTAALSLLWSRRKGLQPLHGGIE